MPHISVKLYPGRSEEQKKEFVSKVVELVTDTLDSSPEHISVAIEEVPQADWEAKVVKPDILAKKQFLYKETE